MIARANAGLAKTGGAEQSDVQGSCSEESLRTPSLEWLAGLSEEEFREVFRGSAVKRAKWAGLVRNACVALGNSGIREGTPHGHRVTKLLKRLVESQNSTVAESARWALSRIQRVPASGGGTRPPSG